MSIDKASIEEYTPCRFSEVYSDRDGVIEITNITGVFRLKGAGRFVWLMLDGKQTVGSIVDRLCIEMGTNERLDVLQEVIRLLGTLCKRKAIVVNWDPIYKLQKSQELNEDE